MWQVGQKGVLVKAGRGQFCGVREATTEQLTETSWVGSHPCFFPLSTAAVPPPSPLLDHHHTVPSHVFLEWAHPEKEHGAPSYLAADRQTNSAPISLTDNHHTDRLSAGKSWATSVWFGLTGKDETTLQGTQTRNQMHAEMKKKTERDQFSFCDWTVFQFYWHWS